MFTGDVSFAFFLTVLAGLSTGIGSFVALFSRRTNGSFLALSLGFSAGIMLYVSFMEMLPSSLSSLTDILGAKLANLYLIPAFFSGIVLISVIDFVIPKGLNPHEVHGVEEMRGGGRLRRTGLLIALTVGLHNFPEGIATFTSALESLDVAIPIVVAIAIHNIPEGIAVSVPIYHSTGSRRKAFWYSFASGLSEPVGALIAYLFLRDIWTPTMSSIVLAVVSGIMVFISLDELLPAAEKYGRHHHAILGVVFGMFVMALSLYLFV
ncbi:MAG: zinc transporter ZupT [Dysgonamonadaceae bacterium]|jgi:ZIP family zinc transporter|nr:zinc transporter ZupT [Dysgonamonadaceae bacterium]